MTLADAGRTVIDLRADQNFDRRVDPAGEQKDAGIPQALYLENVIPTVNGFQSVGYTARNVLPPRASGAGAMQLHWAVIVPMNTGSDSALLIAREGTSSYHDVIANRITCDSPWQYHAGTVRPANTSPTYHSVAQVRGANYWCDKTSLFSFTISISYQPTFVDISGTVTGITVGNIVSICSSYNYLVALLEDNSIAWSSTTTPTDFTPSLVTGAGSATPSGLIGKARYLVEHPSGFIIYAEGSAVFAQYTGNARYPFKFTPIANCGGLESPEQVTGSYNTDFHYLINQDSTIQVIDGNKAVNVAEEISTYLERKKYADSFNYTTNEFSRKDISGVNNSIFYLKNRYLITNSFFYDTLLQRYGKLNISYSYIFSYKNTITFVPNSATGIPYTISLDIYDIAATFSGVLFLGKFQFVRDRHLQLEEVDIESAQDSAYITRNFSLLLYPSLDGKNFSSPVTLATTATGNLIKAKTHKTALSHSLMLKGAFDVNTVALKFRIAGAR